jgi:hypothetical protein
VDHQDDMTDSKKLIYYIKNKHAIFIKCPIFNKKIIEIKAMGSGFFPGHDESLLLRNQKVKLFAKDKRT